MSNAEIVTLPVLPISNAVLFPCVLMPLAVSRPTSVAALQAAAKLGQDRILVVAQRAPSIDAPPRQEDLYAFGTEAVIKQMVPREDGSLALVVLGTERGEILRLQEKEDCLQAEVRRSQLPEENGAEVEALHRTVLGLAGKALSLPQPRSSQELTQFLAVQGDPLRLVYFLGSVLGLDITKGQALLEAATRRDALRLMHSYLAHEVQVLELSNKIATEAQNELSREQRQYFLRQQLRAIQEELGEQDAEQAEVTQLRELTARAVLPGEVRKEAERELGRLEKLPCAAPDYHVVRSYLELVLDLPWGKNSRTDIDIRRALEILDEDHFGLKEVKERICEHLAVLKLNPQARGPILCFVGPPGVGKTSLGQSIARAMGRKFERISLGGLHDEAELRGHRRTYIGAMPGRIIQAIRRTNVNNPVLMLDEVDKIGRDFRGDPVAALLEILDPQQNASFRDNYLDLPFDLSNVLFIVTANTVDTIPQPLLDRMEVLSLSGYTEEEKMQIAARYLVPRQRKEIGLSAEQLKISPEALERIIRRFTREAGVRQLERTIGRLARKAAIHLAKGNSEPITVAPEQLTEMLGGERFFLEESRKRLPAGVASGLAWTESGGDILYIEALLLPEGRGLTLTGHLGEVMQESARAAHSYIWAHCDELGIDRSRFRKSGVHVHVPAGAIPKDGPSAGTTMAVALASLYTGRPARRDTALTGEITLSGMVLPVGGIKEKMLAARRAGIRRVILPKANERDLRDVPDHARAEMEFVLVESIEEVLTAAFAERMQPLRRPPDRTQNCCPGHSPTSW